MKKIMFILLALLLLGAIAFWLIGRKIQKQITQKDDLTKDIPDNQEQHINTGDSFKRSELVKWLRVNKGDRSDTVVFINAISDMSTSEIDTIYEFIFGYFAQGKKVPDSLSKAVRQIFKKYHIHP